jgi:hypothetical protein
MEIPAHRVSLPPPAKRLALLLSFGSEAHRIDNLGPDGKFSAIAPVHWPMEDIQIVRLMLRQ